MKKINISGLKKDLDNISSNLTKKTIIINNAELYNDLITAYKADKKTGNIYIIYQLNGMIIKQLNELEKISQSKEDEDDDFIKTIKNITELQQKKPTAFAVVNKDSEKRNVE